MILKKFLKEDIFSETLEQQFEIVKKLTNLSHVTEFGDMTMGDNFKVSDFQAEKGQSYKPTLSMTRMPPRVLDLKRIECLILFLF